jgi:hypothetical protein
MIDRFAFLIGTIAAYMYIYIYINWQVYIM